MRGTPLLSAAAMKRPVSLRGERSSSIRTGPPEPWNSDWPRWLSSAFRKYGSTSDQPQALAPVEHRVHVRGATEALTARDVERAVVAVGLRLGREVPVELGLELLCEG